MELSIQVLEEKKLTELYKYAKEFEIPNFSKMKKLPTNCLLKIIWFTLKMKQENKFQTQLS